MIRTLSALAALAVLTLPACRSPEHKVILSGSSTVAPVLSEIARSFQEEHPDVRVDIQTGGSSRGIADVRSDVADIGMVSRPMAADEGDLVSTTIAWDGIAPITHASNPVDQLTSAQVVALFTGQHQSWKELGGLDAEVVIVHKAEGRATQRLFLEHFGLRNEQIQADVIIGENEQGIQAVEANPGAIAYVSIGAAALHIASGGQIRMVELDGVAPSLENVRLRRFPLARPLNLVTLGPPPPGAVKDLLAYAASPAAAQAITESSFVPAEP